jgi:hypothetical protein
MRKYHRVTWLVDLVLTISQTLCICINNGQIDYSWIRAIFRLSDYAFIGIATSQQTKIPGLLVGGNVEILPQGLLVILLRLGASVCDVSATVRKKQLAIWRNCA